jgi:hypothetical protein
MLGALAVSRTRLVRGDRIVTISDERLTSVPKDVRIEFGEPFPFTLDMKQINS